MDIVYYYLLDDVSRNETLQARTFLSFNLHRNLLFKFHTENLLKSEY